ncbi:MAG: tetratricopeptide repeat protein [Myxococcota bacterium]
MLARVYLDQGKIPKGQQEIDATLQQFPGNPQALELRGRLSMQQGNRDAAIAMLQQALQTEPNLVHARQWLAELGVAAPPPGTPAAATPMPPTTPGGGPAIGHPAAPPPTQPPQAMPGRLPFQAPGVSPVQQAPVQQAPVQQPQQSQVPGMPVAGSAPGQAPVDEATPAAESPSLEHVGDFFASETLGFTNEPSGIETAGPGRLTILGFVPKSTGSIQTTIKFLLAGLAVAAAFIMWQWARSEDTKKIDELFQQVRASLEADTYTEYTRVLGTSEKIFEIDDENVQAISADAFANAVLAVEFGESDKLGKARTLLEKLKSAEEPTPWSVASAALLAYTDGKFAEGIKEVKDIADRSSVSIVHMELVRLLRATQPNSEETASAVRKLIQVTTAEVRPFNYLGWYYLEHENWTQADKFFSQALQNPKGQGHPRALLGKALTDLERGIGLKEIQKEVDKHIKQVLERPKDDLSPRILALGYFVRSQFKNWQEDTDGSEADYKMAIELDPKNGLFPFRRGAALLKLGKGKQAVPLLTQAVELSPSNPAIYRQLIEAHTQARDFPAAYKALDEAIKLDPDGYEFQLLRGDLLRAERKFDEAKEAYEKIDQKTHGGPAYARAQIGYGNALMQAGDNKRAASHFEKFLRNAPATVGPELQAEVFCDMGLAQENSGDKEVALETYRSGIEIHRYYPECHFYLARGLRFRGPEARDACKTYLTLAPQGRHANDCRNRGR